MSPRRWKKHEEALPILRELEAELYDARRNMARAADHLTQTPNTDPNHLELRQLATRLVADLVDVDGLYLRVRSMTASAGRLINLTDDAQEIPDGRPV